MSFFLLEEEQAATLEAALAFIEAYGDDNSSSDHSTDAEHSLDLKTPSSSLSASSSHSERDSDAVDGISGNGDHVDHNMSLKQQQQNTSHPRRAWQRSREENAKAVKQYRNRIKSEILELRVQALQLSSRLKKLQTHYVLRVRTQTNYTLDTSGRGNAWQHHRTRAASEMEIDHSLVEFRKLQQSQLLNRKLKEALKKQMSLNKLLESLFQRQIAKRVSTRRVHSCMPPPGFDSNTLLALGPVFRPAVGETCFTVWETARPRRRAHVHRSFPSLERRGVSPHRCDFSSNQHPRYFVCVQQ